MFSFLKKWFKPKEYNVAAGIIDVNGGLRVVVGPLGQMWCHLGPNEKLYILPEQKFDEDNNNINAVFLIKTIEDYIQSKQ